LLLFILISVYITLPWASVGMGIGALVYPPPWKYCKVLFVLQMLSLVSVDDVFMHYFEKMSSTFPSFRPPSLPTPEEDPVDAHTPCCRLYVLCAVLAWWI